VGVGQSNYEIASYTKANVGGMANLLDVMVNKKLPVQKIIMIASMTSYGEGQARCPHCGIVKPDLRPAEQLAKSDWVVRCPLCNKATEPVATDEITPLANNSVYSLTKYMQEQTMLLMGHLYATPVVSLRCFNVYGPRQSLSNPYTGVSAIFLSRLKNDHQPVVYEDGMQTRDFISVHDVVNALTIAMTKDEANYQVINIGSGMPTPIIDVANILAGLLEKNITPLMNGEYRLNDLRHCFADIAIARKVLGWKPKVTMEQGFAELIDWSREEEAEDLFEDAQEQLRNHKLL
jgi:dTDP-L-rhamnose 4-epimerase